MASVTITDVHEDLIRSLDRQARAEGISLEQLAARLLRFGAAARGDARRVDMLIADMAWLRRSQGAQVDDATADVRALRDGTPAGTEPSPAA